MNAFSSLTAPNRTQKGVFYVRYKSYPQFRHFRAYFFTFSEICLCECSQNDRLSCYILADTFFIARGIGSDALAALNLVLPAYSLLNGTGLMIGMGGGSRYSLSSTHPEGETHRTVFTQSVLLAVIAAIFSH